MNIFEIFLGVLLTFVALFAFFVLIIRDIVSMDRTIKSSNTLGWVGIIFAIMGVSILINNSVEKYTSINALNGKVPYEMQIVYNASDTLKTTPVDTTYIYVGY